MDSDLAASANLKVVPHQFDAITATFHAMNASQKAQALDGLIAEQDGPTLAALIEAPGFVTGLQPEQRANLKSRIFRRANPEAFRLREQVGKALRKFDAASLPNIAGINALLAGTDRYDNATRHAEAVAQRTGFAA